MTSKNLQIDWTVREHQPMHLHMMQEFSRFMHDEDTALFSSLIDGVPTGFSDDIPGSNCFSKKDDEIEMVFDLYIRSNDIGFQK